MIKSVWPKEDRKDVNLKILLFLISPLLGLLYSLRTMNRKSSYVIFFLFSIVFGLSFTVSNVRTLLSGDGISYRIDFEAMQNESYNEYKEGLLDFLSFDDGQKDYYFDTVAFFISRVTDNYHIMFFIFSIIFSYFALKTFRFLTQEKEFHSFLSCIIIVFLFSYNQIFNINGMRFWTAAWIGVYCIFQIVQNKNKKYYILLLTTPFFHGSFWFFIGVFLISQLTKKAEKLWILLFFLSFLFSSIAPEIISESATFLPEFLLPTVDFYTDVEYVTEQNRGIGTGWWWVDKLFSILVRIYINIMVLLFIINRKLVKSNQKTYSLYLFLIPYIAIINFVMSVPSLGGRYIVLAYSMIAYIWMMNFSNKKYSSFLLLLPLVFFMNIYHLIFNYLNVLEPCFFFTSPIYLIFKYLFLL